MTKLFSQERNWKPQKIFMIGQKLSDLDIIYILSYGNFTTIFFALKYSTCFPCKFSLNNMPAKNKKEVGKLWIDTNWKVLNECVREDFALLIFSIFIFAKLVFHFYTTELKMHTCNAHEFKQYNTNIVSLYELCCIS